MPDLLDPFQGLDLLAGLPAAHLPIDELDRLEETARSLGLPDLAKTPCPQSLDQPIAQDQFAILGTHWGHRVIAQGRDELTSTGTIGCFPDLPAGIAIGSGLESMYPSTRQSQQCSGRPCSGYSPGACRTRHGPFDAGDRATDQRVRGDRDPRLASGMIAGQLFLKGEDQGTGTITSAARHRPFEGQPGLTPRQRIVAREHP